MKNTKLIIIASLFTFSLLYAQGNIKSQWRGPFRTGVYPNESLLKVWPQNGPKLLWYKSDIGEGYSSPAVTKETVYVNGMIDGTGFLHAYDRDGKLKWKTNYGQEWDESYPGARSTPTVLADKIYFGNAHTQVFCFNVADGKQLWQRNLTKNFSAENLRWGITESLLIVNDRLYCTPGGSDVFMAVLDRNSGKTINTIQLDGKESAYCSPVLITHNDRDLILTMSENSLVCIDAASEKVLWQKTHRTRYDINPNTPIYQDGFVYITSGYGTTGSQMFRLNKDGSDADLVWNQKTLDSQMGGAVWIDGYIYGSGHSKKGWHCLDAASGAVKYSYRESFKKGNIIYADGMLYCYDEGGQFGLVQADPSGFNLISDFEVSMGSDQHWAHPVISDGHLFIRHGEALMVYDIARK
jgi:outer membrane protein assembly factor BamB